MIGRLVLAGVVLASVFFAGGFLARPLVLSTESYREVLGVGAYVTVRAYHADGSLFAIWEGHNALTQMAKNTIAACLSGLDTTPNVLFSTSPMGCTSVTQTLLIRESATQFDMSKAATKSLLPSGCGTDFPANCTGWKLEATFDAEITQAASIDKVFALATGGAAFNEIPISPALAIAPSDRLIITLNFNVP